MEANPNHDIAIRHLRSDYNSLHNDIEKILTSHSHTANGEGQLRKEMLRKADHATRIEFGHGELSAAAHNSGDLKHIRARLTAMRDAIQAYKEFLEHHQQAVSIQTSLETVQKTLEQSDTNALDASLSDLQQKKIRSPLDTAAEWKSPLSASASDLAADVHSLILTADNKKKLKRENAAEVLKMKATMNKINSQMQQQGLESASMEASLAALKSGGIHDSTFEEPVTLLELGSEASGEDTVPYVSDEDAEKAFNADNDNDFTAKMVKPSKKHTPRLRASANYDTVEPTKLQKARKPDVSGSSDQNYKLNMPKKHQSQHMLRTAATESMTKPQLNAPSRMMDFKESLRAAWKQSAQKRRLQPHIETPMWGSESQKIPDPQLAT